MTDQHDPLAGRDPYPREQIDVLGLHRERAELLEEIVSTPGPGATAPSTRTKVLLPIGIAAALALVGGVAWFASSGDDTAADDAPVAAASSTAPSDEPTATDPADEPTASTEPSELPEEVPLSEVRRGDVLSAVQCRKVGREDTTVLRIGRRASLQELQEGLRRPRVLLYAVADGGKRVIVVDRKCRVVQAGRNGRGWLDVRIPPRPREEPSDQR